METHNINLKLLHQQIDDLTVALIERGADAGRVETDLAQAQSALAAVQDEIAATQAELRRVKNDLIAVEFFSPAQFQLLHMSVAQFQQQQDLDQAIFAATKQLADLILRLDKAKSEAPAIQAKVASAQARHDELLSAYEKTKAAIAPASVST